MIYEDPAFAERMLRRFRNLIDYQLGLSLRTHTTLRDEISFLTDYLELEKSRRSAFGFGILGAPELLDTRVPVLLFIPFVENAVKFCGTADGRIPRVDVSFSRTEAGLCFRCRVLGVGACRDVIEFLTPEALVAVTAVHQSLQLAVDIHVVNRTREDDNVGFRHLFDDEGSLIVSAYGVGRMLVALVEEVDFVVVKKNLFHIAAGFTGSADELVAEKVRVASLPRGQAPSCALC